MTQLASYTATFTNGAVVTSPLRNRHGFTHAWLAHGRLSSGKEWRLSGFSRSEKSARDRMTENTRHLRRTAFDFAEVSPAQLAGEKVPA